MEGEAIGTVLARASELRSKINDCIDRCGTREADRRGGGGDGAAADEEEEGEEEEELDNLVSIRDAFESLEQQLSALQALQQQQRYEREAALHQIDRSRMILLSKLKEYKGEDLEVIHEASTFAGGPMEHDEDLILPPYPSHLADSYDLDDLHPFSRFNSEYKSSRNRLNKTKEKNSDESEEKQSNHHLKGNSAKGLRLVLGLVAKSVLTIVSVVSVLRLAGFKPAIEKRGTQFNIMELFSKPGSKDAEVQIQCPPGKVMVMEDGKLRCLVKERVEIPFELDVKAPDVSYGFG